MNALHPFSYQFLSHIAVTQSAYKERRLDEYLAGFAECYYSVHLNTQWAEDRRQLRDKINADFARYELLNMDYEVIRHWFVSETGYAHLSYFTRLRFRDSGRVLVDTRENLIVAEHSGQGKWEITSKIILSAQNYFETENGPNI